MIPFDTKFLLEIGLIAVAVVAYAAIQYYLEQKKK